MKNIVLMLLSILSSYVSIGQQHIANDIKDYLDRAYDLERFSGTIFVQKGSEVLVKKTYGFANIEDKVKNRVQTKFNIGSITKQFTATAILLLQQEGKLKLHESINTYLGEFASKRWDRVTVHHLLSHQSGIPSILQSGQGLDHYWPQETPISWKDQLDYFKDLKLNNAPGEEYSYSNTGYVLLALIIEQVSGKSYECFMREELFLPNGLNATSVNKEGDFVADNHYNYRLRTMEKAPEYHYSWYRGAGGIFSTVEDLNKWYHVVHHGKLLSNANKEKLFRVHAKNYGYGWVIQDNKNQKLVYHDGTDFGSTSFFLTVPKEDLRIIILTNQTHKDLNKLGKSERWIKKIGYNLLDMVNGSPVEKLPKVVGIEDEHENFVGSYRLSDGTTFSICKKGNGLKLTQDGAGTSLLRFKYHQSINPENDVIAHQAIEASSALLEKRFWRFTKYGDWEIKAVYFMGFLSSGFKKITKPLGDLQKAVVYEVGKRSAKVRFFGKQGSVDFNLVFDENGKIQGLFDTGYFDHIITRAIEVRPIVNGRLFIDGFHTGELDAILKFNPGSKNKQLIMEQGGRSFFAYKLNSF
ncbi:serine hydrolase domain-containing protein [Flagellimonas sp.]|jgi:CubicO group peptidase (beta-lactamase class C family)|uniref:serine hydrolase domain-containing protein n=1 Tax=Flagellimonas sp. TaxID=2058762 RepID=UPI003BAAAF60